MSLARSNGTVAGDLRLLVGQTFKSPHRDTLLITASSRPGIQLEGARADLLIQSADAEIVDAIVGAAAASQTAHVAHIHSQLAAKGLNVTAVSAYHKLMMLAAGAVTAFSAVSEVVFRALLVESGGYWVGVLDGATKIGLGITVGLLLGKLLPSLINLRHQLLPWS